MSSLLNFHVCWYAHFILILLTQTAGDTSVNKKAANHVCFWFGFFKLLMISAGYNSKLLQILSFTLIEADHQHLILVYCHRYKLKPYYMMPNVISQHEISFALPLVIFPPAATILLMQFLFWALMCRDHHHVSCFSLVYLREILSILFDIATFYPLYLCYFSHHRNDDSRRFAAAYHACQYCVMAVYFTQ